jgi:hypothetical protein
MMSFPRKEIVDAMQTLAEAQLHNCNLMISAK